MTTFTYPGSAANVEELASTADVIAERARYGYIKRDVIAYTGKVLREIGLANVIKPQHNVLGAEQRSSYKPVALKGDVVEDGPLPAGVATVEEIGVYVSSSVRPTRYVINHSALDAAETPALDLSGNPSERDLVHFRSCVGQLAAEHAVNELAGQQSPSQIAA